MSLFTIHRCTVAVFLVHSLCALAHSQDASDARAQDRVAIEGMMQSLLKACEARDAKQVAAHWTFEGELQNDLGVQLQGRPALEEAFTAVLAKTAEVKANRKNPSLRFLSQDSAIEEGVILIQRGLAEPTTEAEYSALLVREDGKWLIAQLTESSIQEDSLEDLAWLIGDWKTTVNDAVELRSSYSWNGSKNFIHVRFSRTEQDVSVSGDQVLGVDPATGQIRAWIFEADGGIGESYWQRDGDHWTATLVATLADGRTLTETNVLRRINDDSFTWQSIGRALDDQPLPDLSPNKVERIRQQ
jgi:uncharacterized protein (TIGR02246 family)